MPEFNLNDIDLSNLMTYLTILVGIAVLAGVLGGFMKGLKKTIYTTIIFIGVYVGAWVALPMVTDLLYEYDIGSLVTQYAGQYVGNLELFGGPITSVQNLLHTAIGSFVPGAETIMVEGSASLAFIEGTAKMVLRIVAFFVMISVGGIVLTIVGRILWTFLFKGIFGDTRYKDKDKTKKRNRFRLLGAAVGGVKGLFEALVILVPIGGLMSIMSSVDPGTLRVLLGENPAQQTSLDPMNNPLDPAAMAGIDTEAIISFIEEYPNSILAQTISQIKVGPDLKQIDYYIFDELGKIETSGNRKIFLREEIVIVLEVVSEFPEVFSGEGIDPFAIGDDRIDTVIGKLKQSRLIPEMIIIGIDYAKNMEEVTSVVDEYDIDITVLETIDWYAEVDSILTIGGNVLKLGNPTELDIFNIPAEKITNITTSIAASQIVNVMLPVAVNYALNMEGVNEIIGEIDYDLSGIDWGNEIIAIGNIFIEVTELGIDPTDEFDLTILDRLKDEEFFENVLDVVGAISSSGVITQLAPALADYFIASAIPEDFQGILSFSNLQQGDWEDEFRRLLNIAVAIIDLGLMNPEEFDFTTMDVEALRSIIENMFDLVVIQGNEGVLVQKIFALIPELVEGFEPNLDPSLNWKEQALQFVNIIEAVQALGITDFNEFDPLTLFSADSADAVANILIQLNHSLIIREIIPALINSLLAGEGSADIGMGLSLEDFLSEWLTRQTTIDPDTGEKIPMASVEEWDAEIVYISRMLIIAMQIMDEDMTDLSKIPIGDIHYNAATTETFTTENAGFAQILYLINYSKSFNIEGIRVLLSTFLVGEESLITTEKSLGIVTPQGEQTLLEAWNDEIVALMGVINEMKDLLGAIGGEPSDIMDQLTDPSKVENILLGFNDSQVLRVVMPDLIHSLLDTSGMQDFSTTWLSDQVGIDAFGENNPTAPIAEWELEIKLLARLISGIGSVLDGGFDSDFTAYEIGDVNNHPMMPDGITLNPDFDTTEMGLAEMLFLINYTKSFNINAISDMLGEFLVGEDKIISTDKELGTVTAGVGQTIEQAWDAEIITLISVIDEIKDLLVNMDDPDFDFMTELSDPAKVENILLSFNDSTILRVVLPDLIYTLLDSSGMTDWATDWIFDQTGATGVVADSAEWELEIKLLAKLISGINSVLGGGFESDFTAYELGDVNNHPMLNDYSDINPDFDASEMGLAEMLFLINHTKSFNINAIRDLLGEFLVGEDKIISTDKELGSVTAGVGETIEQAWDAEIIQLISVLEEVKDVLGNMDDPDFDFMTELSDPTKVEGILGAFNGSTILRVVLPDLIYTLLDSSGMTDWSTSWLFDQTGALGVVADSTEWELEIKLLAKLISGINSVLGGGFGSEFTDYELGDVNNHPMLSDYSDINPDFDANEMGLAEILYLVNHAKSFDIEAIRDLLGEFLVGEGSFIETDKELGYVPGNTPLEKTENWDDEIITIIELLTQYNVLFGEDEGGDFLSALDDSSKIKNLMTPINHSYILREVLPDMINTILTSTGTSDLDGWFTDWLQDQVGLDDFGANKPVASIADWDQEIDILAKLITVFNNSFGGSMPSDFSTINTGDATNHPILLGEDYDDTNPGMAELLFLMNYSNIFDVSEVRSIIGDFLVGPGKLIDTEKELGTITAGDEAALLLAWDEEIVALIRIINHYNTLFGDVEGTDFLDKLTERSDIEDLLGSFNESVILREVLPDLLYSVMPADIVSDWVDTWLVDQVGVDILGDNKPVASKAEWTEEISNLAGMIEAYNKSFSGGFAIDFDTMNLGDVDNNPRLLGVDYDNTSPGLAEILYFMNQSQSFKIDEIRNILADFLIGEGKLIDTEKELGTITGATPEERIIAWDAEIYALVSVMESYNTTFAGGGDFLEALDDRSKIEALLGKFNDSILLREVLPDMLYSVMPSDITTDWVDTWLVAQVGVDGGGLNKPVASKADWTEEISNLAGMIEAYNKAFSGGFAIDLDTMNLGDVDNNPRILGNAYDNTNPGLAEMLYFMNQTKSFKIDEIRNILADFMIGEGKLIDTEKELGEVTGATWEDLVIAWDAEIYALVSVMNSYNTTFAGGGDFLAALDDRTEIETLLGRFNESIILRAVLPDMLYSVLPADITNDWVDTWLVDQVGVDLLGENNPVASKAEWTTEISNIAGMIEAYNKSFATGFNVDLATMPLGDVDNNPRILGNAYDNTNPGLAEMLYFMNQTKSFKIDEIRNILADFLIGPGKLITTSKELGLVTGATEEELVIAWDAEIHALVSVMISYNATFTGGDFLEALDDRTEIETLLGRFNESIMLREVLPDMLYSVLPDEIITDWVDTWLTNQVGIDGEGDNKPVASKADWTAEISNIAGMIEAYNKSFATGFTVDLGNMPLGDVDNNPRILGIGYDNTAPGLAEMLYFMNQSKSFKIDELRNILADFMVGPGKLINTQKQLGTVTAATPEDQVIAWDEEIKDLIMAIEKYNDITGSGPGAPLDLFSALDDEATISDILGAFNKSVMLREVLPDLINDISTSVGMTNWISPWLTNQVGIDGLGDNKPIQPEAVWAVEVTKIAKVISEANNAFGGDFGTLDISDSAFDADALGSVLHAMNDTETFILDELNVIMKDGLNNMGYNVTNLNDKPTTKGEWTLEIDAIVSIIKDLQLIGDVSVLDWNAMDTPMVDSNLNPVIRDIDATTRQVTRGELLGLMLNTMGDSIILAPAMDQIIGSVFTSGGFTGYVDLTSIDLTELDWVDEIRAITSIKSDFDAFDGGGDLRTLGSGYIENMILNASQGVISSQIMGNVLMDQFALILGAKNPIDPVTSEPYDWTDKDDLAANAKAIGNMIALGEALAAMFTGSLDDYEDVGNAMKGLQPDPSTPRPAFADIYLPAFVDYASGEDGMLDSVDMTTVDYVLEGDAFNQFFEDWDRSSPMNAITTLPTAQANLAASGSQVSLLIIDSILDSLGY